MSDPVITRPATPGPNATQESTPPDREPPRAARPVPSRGNRLRMLVTALLFSYFWAALCNALLDLVQSGGDVKRLFTYELDEARLIFLVSAGVLWVVMCGLWALTNRLALAAGLMLAAVTVVGFADNQKLTLRREPLYPSDLSFAGHAGFLTSMIGVRAIILVVLVLVLEVLVLVLIGRRFLAVYPRIRRRTEPRRWWALTVARVVALLTCIAFIAYLGTFNDSGNKLRRTYEAAGAHWAFWFQEVNYARHGFVAGFLYNLNTPAMTMPPGYSRATMDALSQKYAAKADQVNASRSAAALDGVNVVVVLSEAFSDPTRIQGPSISEDPIPFTRQLMSRTTSGTMLAQLFGGGTANMEFETLTGFSLSQFLPQMNTPYQMLVTKTPTFPSVVGYLKGKGHEPLAVHPYMTSMYKRYAVYPTLGFDKFIHDTTMQDPQRIDHNEFISDASAFDEARHQIATSDRPVLLNLITMQNHYPMSDEYSNPVPVSGVDAETKNQLGNYARGLRYSDEAMREFLSELSKSREKTAVVFYGDHEPAFWPDSIYKRNGDTHMRETPFFLWTNFKQLPHRALPPLTSPIYFLPMLFDELHAPLPPYYVLLDELRRQIPAMEQGEYFLPDGRKVSWSQLSPKAQRLLHDYRLVQYDLAVGHRYSQAQMFYPDNG